MSIITISRRSLIASGLAAASEATFQPVFAKEEMSGKKMQSLIDYTLRQNTLEKKAPVALGLIRPFLFGSQEVLMWQIGNDEGALKERFSVTVNLSQQHVILFSRSESAVYFHLTGVHLRREKSAINRKQGGPSFWTAPEAVNDFDRQMSYWAGRSTG